MNLLWLQGKIPLSWKTQCVIPILKPDKPPNEANSYRPISLSSCIGKVFENMIKTRLDWYVEANNILPPFQNGFRRGRSCSDSFISLISDLKLANYNKSHAVCIFLDVQGAFDNVDPAILVKILSNINIPGKLCKWIFNFLDNRELYVKFNNILHGPRQVFKGTMQGATLSPLLYNLYTSDINSFVNSSNVNILQFADDLVIYSINSNLDVAKAHINNALNELYVYYNNYLHLKINPDKSKLLILSKDTTNVNIVYNNEIIREVPSHKFLGVVIDNHLNFDLHAKHIISNSVRGLNVMRCLAGISWGADPQVLSLLYKTLVRSHFDYSFLVHMNTVHIHKLEIIQNKAMRIISGAMCSTPIRAMEVETKTMPLPVRWVLLAYRYLIKIYAKNNQSVIRRIKGHPRIPKLTALLLQVEAKFCNIYKNEIWPCYEDSFDSKLLNITVCTKSINNNTDFLCFLSQIPDYYKLYTDGSKADSHVRSAVYDPQTKFVQSFRLHDVCSIFTAEAYAVFEALESLGMRRLRREVVALLPPSIDCGLVTTVHQRT